MGRKKGGRQQQQQQGKKKAATSASRKVNFAFAGSGGNGTKAAIGWGPAPKPSKPEGPHTRIHTHTRARALTVGLALIVKTLGDMLNKVVNNHFEKAIIHAKKDEDESKDHTEMHTKRHIMEFTFSVFLIAACVFIGTLFFHFEEDFSVSFHYTPQILRTTLLSLELLTTLAHLSLPPSSGSTLSTGAL